MRYFRLRYGNYNNEEYLYFYMDDEEIEKNRLGELFSKR